MDPEPTELFKTIQPFKESLNSFGGIQPKRKIESDSIGFNGASVILIGLTIAIASLGVPVTAVFIGRPPLGENLIPTALKSNGSKTSSSLSITRFSKPGS